MFGFGAVGKHSSCLVLVSLELTAEVIIHLLLGLMYKHELYWRGILLLVTNNFLCDVFLCLIRNANYRSFELKEIICNKGLHGFAPNCKCCSIIQVTLIFYFIFF